MAPTAEPTEKLDNDLTMLGDKLSKSFGNIKVAGI